MCDMVLKRLLFEKILLERTHSKYRNIELMDKK